MLTVVRSDVDAVVATQVTADELFALENDGYRYDLLAGNLIRMSPAGFRHGRLAAEFAYRLRAFVGDHPGLGVVVGAETGFRGRGSGRGRVASASPEPAPGRADWLAALPCCITAEPDREPFVASQPNVTGRHGRKVGIAPLPGRSSGGSDGSPRSGCQGGAL